MRKLFLVEILIIILVSYLVFLVGAKYFSQPAGSELTPKIEKFLGKLVEIPLDAEKTSYTDYRIPLLYKATWIQNNVPITLIIFHNLYDSETKSYVFEVSLRESNPPYSHELEKVIIDEKMLQLLKENPRGFRRLETNTPGGEQPKSLNVSTWSAGTVTWSFDRDFMNKQLVSNKSSILLNLENKLLKLTSFIPLAQFIPFTVLPSIFLGGLTNPGKAVFYLMYFLLPTVALTFLVSILKKDLIKNLVRINILLLLLLFFTIPLLTFIYPRFIDVFH